jgi:endoglucanase
MFRSIPRPSIFLRIAGALLALTAGAPCLSAQSAYVRVNQAGYESSQPSFRAYLMSPIPAPTATFAVINSKGITAFSGPVGALLGTWSHNPTTTYQVYALDFTVPAGDLYTIAVSGPAPAHSPQFAVDSPEALYSGLLLNTLFFYETQRDGANFIPNALRTAPGHLRDSSAQIYDTPPLDSNDYIDNPPPTPPLVSAQLPNRDVSGGWWDAGDYMKYVETISYTAALMQIGVRDFPRQMGALAPLHPPAPPTSVSYSGNSGPGAPPSSDFTAEAAFGIDWLLKIWDDPTRTLYYQVDNSQDWDYYGEGDPSSANPNCGGTYATPYCLLTEYDIWTLPQAADNYQQPGDPKPCDPRTTFFICHRPVYPAGPAGAPISPNLAGRLTADFALCAQLNRATNPALADQCLLNAEHIFVLANTSYSDPAPYGALLTISPFDGYPESVWDDDMELGATELYFALQSALQFSQASALPSNLPQTDPFFYLRQAAHFAHRYITNVYNQGNSDTLNLYDVSGLAHFELYRALASAGNPAGLAVTQAGIRAQLLRQTDDAITESAASPFRFGYGWQYGDTTSHGAGLSVMASEAYSLTHAAIYNTFSQNWLGNILGANPWGSSFIVGAGRTFPNCIQHQVANIAGSLHGSSGATPILWGAAVEGPDSYYSTGTLTGMRACPLNGIDTFAQFDGNAGPFDPSQLAVYRDNVQSYSTTEPGIDLTSTSFLMWSWRMAKSPTGAPEPQQ